LNLCEGRNYQHAYGEGARATVVGCFLSLHEPFRHAGAGRGPGNARCRLGPSLLAEIRHIVGRRDRDRRILRAQFRSGWQGLCIRFTAAKEIFAEGQQAEVVVTDSTKKVVSRKRIADLYVGGHGWSFVPVYLADVACRPLTVTVTGGGKRIVKSLPFSCGE
jgi:hypothetical protein